MLGVTTAAYYKSINRGVSDAQKNRDRIMQEIIRIHNEPKKNCYGSPRVHRELLAADMICSVNTVARIMQHGGIRAVTAAKFRPQTTDSNHDGPIAPNRFNQHFATQKLNQVWLTDFTYLPTCEDFTYLCTVMDLHSRRIVGYKTSCHIDAQLAVDALRQAIALRGVSAGLIVHSDRGSQFASVAFRSELARHDILPSMSAKGNCYDNAPMESFYKSFKIEEVYQHPKYQTHEEATRGVTDYIERFYNRNRLHSALGYCSPIQFEQQLLSLV